MINFNKYIGGLGGGAPQLEPYYIYSLINEKNPLIDWESQEKISSQDFGFE
jgi:hypothetical protein